MNNIGDSGSARWEFKVSDLLTKLRTNRSAHAKEYGQAVKGYRKKLKDALTDMLRDLKNGEDIETYIQLSKPSSNERDYDRIIEVLEMTTAETVLLTLSEFDRYVRDNWEWTNAFKMSNSAYLSS